MMTMKDKKKILQKKKTKEEIEKGEECAFSRSFNQLWRRQKNKVPIDAFLKIKIYAQVNEKIVFFCNQYSHEIASDGMNT